MKLDKAIEVLSLAAYGHALTTGPEFYDALKVGLEAVKRIMYDRSHTLQAYQLLPGETTE